MMAKVLIAREDRACTACKSRLPLAAQFWSRDRKSPTGFRARCKACSSKADATRYARASESFIARARARFASDPDAHRARMRAYYATNREALKAKSRARKEALREEINAKNREAYAADRENRRAKSVSQSRKRRAEKPDVVRAYHVAWRNSRPHQRVRHTIGNAIRSAIRANKAGRSWEALVGYDLPTLMRHIERQFAAGMNWNNYGRGASCWHIDHIRPVASFSFDTSDDPGFRECWALTNLRPLWEPENLSKKAVRTLLI